MFLFSIVTLILLIEAKIAKADTISVNDDLGRKITLEKPAQRLIALYGAYNEILSEMGQGNRLIARTKADSYPESMVSKPSIGTHMRPNIELILGLKPDLIIQNAGRKEAMVPVRQLIAQGLNVAVFNADSFLSLFSVINRLGTLTGENEAADRLICQLKQRLEVVASCIAQTKKRPSVLFEVRYPDLLAAGTDSIVDEVIRLAGGRNILNQKKKFVRLNIEEIIRLNPDFYVIQKGPMNRDPGPPDKRPHFDKLDAVKHRRVLIVEEQVFSRPGPRSVSAVEDLSKRLHPDLFEKHE